MLQWGDGASWEHRAYWGANKIDFGADGTESRRYMGPLPTAAQWVRLEVPASLVGQENKGLNAMAFTLFGGRATWDHAGKTSRRPLLAGHWKFDEGSGGTAFDSSGNGHHGTLQGGAGWDTGKFNGKALSLDGIDDYVQVGDAPGLKMSNALTISAWIYPKDPPVQGSTGEGGIIVNREGEYEIARFANGTIQWAFANSNPEWNWINTGYVAPEKEWTHIAVVYDYGTIKTYANGRLVYTYDGEGPIGDVDTTRNDFRIGGRQFAPRHFHGLIDEVAIYNRALSAGAIAALTDGAPDDPSPSALAMAEFGYRQAAYEALLVGIGTSYGELRLARGAAPEVREALANRLGVRLTKSSPDELDQLLLQPDSLTEPNLERLLGLVDTTRDSLVPSSKPDLLKWQEAYLEAEWTKQDYPAQPSGEPPPPIIDPDLIGSDDIMPGNTAVAIWTGRWGVVEGWLATLRSQRVAEPTPLLGFDKIVTDTLSRPMPDLLDLVAQSEQGRNIEPELKRLHLTRQTFSYLMRIRNLAQAGTVTDAEWEDVYGILVQVKKSQIYPAWRTVEQESSITLKPTYFKISDAAKELPAWRATQQARRKWQEVLQARIDQQQAVANSLRASVDRAEELALPKLRDALVASIGGRSVADDVAEWLTETFLIDAKGSGSQKTTRILQATETLQGIIFSLRTGQFEETHTADSWVLTEEEERFDTEWQWVGSYATWRAAMLAWLYRENFLLPTLRKDQTEVFETWVGELRKDQRLTPDQARTAAKEFFDALPQEIRNLLPGFTLTEQDMTDQKLRALRDMIKNLLGKTETVWIEDALPAGATAVPGEDGWNWISANPTPYSGTRAHQSNIMVLTHQHYFEGATATLEITKDDRLFAYIYLDPANVPEEVMLQWGDGASWEHRAYWGANKIDFGADGTESRRYMGPLPTAGQWVRLEVPASLVGLENKGLNAMAFTLFGGRATWDHAGKTNRYLQELFYFVPMQLALQLQKSGEHVAALDWYQTVYAYNLPIEERKIYYGLELEKNLTPNFVRGAHWLQRLSPDQLASEWPNSYTRFTLMSLVRCLVEFADAEFTRDTGESIAKARTLYMTARVLLASPELEPLTPTDPNQVLLPNPVLESLRTKAEVQLRKLHNGRNIAGMKRQVETYTALAETAIGLPTVGAGGQLIMPVAAVLRPTPYRYGVLIERGKQLVNLAQQVEAAYLHTLEQLDAVSYRRFQAEQGLNLANARVELQALRVTEANTGKSLAEKQRDRAIIQKDHFNDLLSAGLNWWEQEAIGKLWAAYDWQLAGSITGNIGTLVSAVAGAIVGGVYGTAPGATAGAVVGTIGGALLTGGQIFRDIAAGQSLISQARAMQASFERRRQEWELQASLSTQDELIGDDQVELAKDHVAIVNKEKDISQMEATQAKAMIDFLDKQFLNADLYDWMSGVLAGVYSYFLQQATAVAKLAQNQLSFERQERPPAFIKDDYWQAPAEDGARVGQGEKAPDRRGLTGSARLLQDIYQLDQYAFETNKRKLQLTKTCSLAQLFPAEFQRFRETGVIAFLTPMEMFDRDFPGHYLRLIKRLRTSLIALIPPTQGIRATLTASGISRAVVETDGTFPTVMIRRDPELVALSSPINATGLFELEAQSEMLLPFESMGVDTTWELSMPKAANPFDYRTIADVLITIEYTALNSFDYRQHVIQSLPSTLSGDRPFSFRHQFADQWYDLHNPDQAETAMVVKFDTRREDFPPNIEDLTIQHVLLYFARKEKEGQPFEVTVTSLRFNGQGGDPATTFDGVISTRRGNATSWKPAMIGKTPIGEWELSLKSDDAVEEEKIADRFKNEEIEDILFAITYSGRTPAWPA